MIKLLYYVFVDVRYLFAAMEHGIELNLGLLSMTSLVQMHDQNHATSSRSMILEKQMALLL